LSEGDSQSAALAASWLAMFLLIDSGLMAPVRGWIRRAERLLQDTDESPAHAIMNMVQGYERLFCGDIEAARRHAPLAVELGDRFGVTQASVIGRVCVARLALFDGDITGGLDQLDELATVLLSPDVDPLTTGMMYCELICAAQGLALHDRAREWTDVMERWGRDRGLGTIKGRCRVHRAELLRVSGPCERAEEEALLACEELRPWMRREFGWPLVELGNIRLRKGDLAGAETAFMTAHERAWSAQPGLSLLRLAQGRVDEASRLIAEAIDHPFDTPWKERPPVGELQLAPLYEAQVEIACAAGDLATARRGTDALSLTADHFPSPLLRAHAQLAEARTRLLSGDSAAAKAAAVGAATLYSELGAPFDAAVARMVLARVRTQDGNSEGAQLEWRTALSAFDAYGAARHVELCAVALAGSVDSFVTPEELRSVAVRARFHRTGDTRTVEFGDRSTVIKDLKGFRYIERLLAEPGREFHVLDLVAVASGVLPVAATFDGSEVEMGSAGSMPLLDDAARRAYRQRLAEVDEDIDDAVAMNDPARRELAERDREYLVAELTRAVGLGGRPRAAPDDGERARTAVARAIRYSLDQLAEHHRDIADHLRQRVNTGMYCSYAADPMSPIVWTF
jgi:tetratricopeptide (TPR) repeat protein